MNTSGVGVLGIGYHLPVHVRTNAYWPPELVAAWRGRERSENLLREQGSDDVANSSAVQLALDAMALVKDDPFYGVKERRVIDPSMRPSDMEVAAARDAIQRSGIDPREIGLLLSTSQGPDTLLVSNAPIIHRELQLARHCFSTGIDAACNSTSMQLSLAQAMIRAGAVKYALLVQSSNMTSLARREEPLSPLFGDAATALVVGPCRADAGILSTYHETHGELYSSLNVGNAGGPWQEAIPRIYVADSRVARRMAVNLSRFGEIVLERALAAAGVSATDVDFIATHQGTTWLRRVTQAVLGAERARFCDTFAWTGSVGPANVPLCLAVAEREGLLRSGDIVAGFTGGSGTTIAGFVLRWL